MRLYYAPGACSLSPHIALCEAGLPFSLEKVDLATKKTSRGEDFLAINPKGYVPALRLDSGGVLTEGPAIVQFIADLKPETGLAPRAGTLTRYQLQAWLNFISAEIHKNCVPLFTPGTPAECRAMARAGLERRLGIAAAEFADGRPCLMGKVFTVADGYLFTVLRWMPHLEVELAAAWPALDAFVARTAERPAVREALEQENLLE